MAETMGTKEASEKWGYPQETIREWCKNETIPGATQDRPGGPWLIPKDAQCPMGNKKQIEMRIKTFLIIIFILVSIVVIFSSIVSSSSSGSSSKRTWNDLNEQEKANARWAYYAQQAIDDYGK